MSEPIDLGAELADYGTPVPAVSRAGDVLPLSDRPRSIGRLADMQQQGFAMLPDTTPLRRPTPIAAWTVDNARCRQCQRYLPDGKECSECPPKLADIPVPDQPFAWKPQISSDGGQTWHDSPKSWQDIQGGDTDD